MTSDDAGHKYIDSGARHKALFPPLRVVSLFLVVRLRLGASGLRRTGLSAPCPLGSRPLGFDPLRGMGDEGQAANEAAL